MRKKASARCEGVDNSFDTLFLKKGLHNCIRRAAQMPSLCHKWNQIIKEAPDSNGIKLIVMMISERREIEIGGYL